MPFTFYLSSENQLSIQNIEALQNAARANDTGNIIIGDRQFSVRYQSAMDAFIVNPVQGELYSGLNNSVLDDVTSLADVIESRLNGGSSFLDGKRLVRTVLIFTESSDQLSRATDRVPGLPASPGYVQ